MDETSHQLLGDARPPLAAAPGRVGREDDEYVRGGGCTLFLAVEPLGGWRTVAVTERRTRRDWASFLRDLAAHSPEAECSVVVLDNRNTHGPASFADAFSPAEARAVARRFDFHHWSSPASVDT